MSIADKLKKTLSQTNLFANEELKKEELTEQKQIEAETDDVSPEVNIVSINPKVVRENKFKDLANELVTKIQKTPYWEEFSMKSQEKMISKYFDKKIKSKKYVEIPYSLTDKLTFIEEVLKSVV